MLGGLNPDTREHKYFSRNAQDLRTYQRSMSNKPRKGAETEEEFDQRFLKTVTYNPTHFIYQGQIFPQDFIFEIDMKFSSPAADF
jgi:hypothetical protein